MISIALAWMITTALKQGITEFNELGSALCIAAVCDVLCFMFIGMGISDFGDCP